MVNFSTLLNKDKKPVSQDDNRMANRFLQYWKSVRGDQNLPLIADLDFSEMGEFVPYAFNIDLSTGTDNPKLCFIGRKLIQDCSRDVTNQRVSQLPSNSLLAKAAQHRDEVIAKANPCLIDDDFINTDGQRVLYRAIMLPFSNSGDEIDYIVGAINSKTVALGKPAERATLPARGAPPAFGDIRETHPTPSNVPLTRVAVLRDRKEVSDLIAEVSAAMCQEPSAEAKAGEGGAAPPKHPRPRARLAETHRKFSRHQSTGRQP